MEQYYIGLVGIFYDAKKEAVRNWLDKDDRYIVAYGCITRKDEA
jgi:hypothetical protein